MADTTMHRVRRAAVRLASEAARRIRPNAAAAPPGDRGFIDDIATRRPWNVRVKLERLRARLRVRRLDDGVTVVIVNWNTRDVTGDVVRTVQQYSPPGTRVLLVDNGSVDGSREVFRRWPGIHTLLLRSNAGHGVALDIGVCRSRTTITVTLDSDAVPLRHGWLDPACGPIRDRTAVLAGLRSSRDFVHPVYLAVDTAYFVRSRLSFQVHRAPNRGTTDADHWGVNAWDTGELLTHSISSENVVFVEPAPNRAPGLPGMTVADVVYHHGGVSRSADGRTSQEALVGWTEACLANGLRFDGRTSLGSHR